MHETMGKIIRGLRKERNLTQEELAEQLNVTCQAVSRWETEASLPDIAQIVPLAHVFGVSTDVLFGIAGDADDEQTEAFLREYHQKRCSKPEGISDLAHCRACCADVQKILAVYPNNYKLLACSLGSIVSLLWANHRETIQGEETGRGDEMHAMMQEGIRQANVILHHCSDMEYLDLAHRRLVSIYRMAGDLAKAEEHAKQVVDQSGFQLAVVYEAMGRTEDAKVQYINALYTKLIQIEPILPALGYLYEKQGKWEEAYTCYRLRIDLFERSLQSKNADEPYHPNLSLNLSYDRCASICMKLGRTEEAMDWLEKLVCFGQRSAEKHHHKTSQLPYFYGIDFSAHLTSVPLAKQITNSLQWSVFDPLRGSKRFQVILAKANSL